MLCFDYVLYDDDVKVEVELEVKLVFDPGAGARVRFEPHYEFDSGSAEYAAKN